MIDRTPVRVAVIGSGPSGFYAAESLLKSSPDVHVDMLERLPTPFGLVRGGVAPDHPKIKQVIVVYDRIARMPGFRLLGNVEAGRDVSIEELRRSYHAVVLAQGASADARLGIPGEDLPGCVAASEFVGWYNGHPDFTERRFDLSHEVAVIIGQGNVAADLARMLATPVDQLASTDITDYAVETLRKSRIREIHIVGRRGPAQARFTSNELRELGEIPGCDPVVDPEDLALNGPSLLELAASRGEEAAKNLAHFRVFSTRPRSQPRICRFRFLEGPVSVDGNARVESITLARSRLQGPPFGQAAVPTGETANLSCGLVLRSVGFRGVQLEGVPFDAARGIVPNEGGRVVARGVALHGLYVVGWIKRGASGVIGSNRADSVETVRNLIEDLPVLRGRELDEGLARRLSARAVRVVDYQAWLKLDAIEIERGRAKSKPREKLTDIRQMLELA